MRTQSRSRLGWSAAWALAVVAGAPTLTRAQQTGLFPLKPIVRERVPCPNEDPVYKVYRQQYFGYHPTLWRKFPAGWGMPSPEAPNAAREFKILPRDQPPEPPPSMDGGAEPDQPGPRGNAMPNDGGANPAAPGAVDPRQIPLPSGERSPFELDTPKDGKPPLQAPPRTSPPDGPNASVPDATGPALPPATESVKPAPGTATAPSADRNVETVEPLLSLPDPTVPAGTGGSGGQAASQPAQPLPAGPEVEPTGSPFQAPKRTSLLGNLMNGLRRR